MKRFIALALLLPVFAWSQALPVGVSPVFAPTYAASGATFSGGSATAANAASLSFANPANGALYAESKIGVQTAAGVANVAIRSVPSALNVAGALGRFALKISGPLVVGVALYDLAKELGFNLDNSSGSVQISIPPVGLCTVAPCYKFGYAAAWNLPGTYYANELCGALASANPGVYTTSVLKVYNAQSVICMVSGPWGGPAEAGPNRAEPAPVQLAIPVPATPKQFQDAIAAKSQWPSGSAIGRAVSDAIASGESLPLPQPSSVTGPASITGPVTVSNTPATPTSPAVSVSSQPVSNITYGPNSYTISNVTTTTTNTGGNVSSSTTTTEQPQPDPAPSDTANPDQPKLYTPKYPDGLAGVWNAKKAALLSSPLLNLASSLSPSGIGSSGCPQFSLTVDMGFVNYGTYNLGPPCYVWDFLKVVILISAGFLARALIFGG